MIQDILPGPFTSNTRLRFRCDASGNSDWVYIDDVEISGCFNNNLLSPVEDILEETIVEENDIEETKSIKVYPIPASRTLYVDCKMYDGTKATISLYNIRGSLVKTVSLNGDYSEPQKIDLDKLSDGLYLLVMKDLNGNVLENKRILVSNE